MREHGQASRFYRFEAWGAEGEAEASLSLPTWRQPYQACSGR